MLLCQYTLTSTTSSFLLIEILNKSHNNPQVHRYKKLVLWADKSLPGKNIFNTLKACLLLCSKQRTIKIYKYQNVRGPHYKALWVAFLTGQLFSVNGRWTKYKYREL
jgi:hypothetical protein